MSEMKNRSSNGNTSTNSLEVVAMTLINDSKNNIATITNILRLTSSEGEMEPLIRFLLSSNSVASKGNCNRGSNANLKHLLYNITEQTSYLVKVSR